MELKFEAHRSPTLGTHAAVATSQPLASDIGVRILRSGGNAVDAAVAIAAALNVTEPCSTGLGGDCFMLYFHSPTSKVYAMNGSGAAPSNLNLEKCLKDLKGSGIDISVPATAKIPHSHPHAVTVPGSAAGWVDAVDTFGSGKLSLAELLEPAALLAEEGFPVSPITAQSWTTLRYQLDNSPCGGELLMPNGKAPMVGEVFRNPTLAGVLRELGQGGKMAFYEGRIGSAIVQALQSKGGLLTMEDLKVHSTSFVEPISVEFEGIRVHEVPPNGQGITALLALNILKHMQVPGIVSERGAGEEEDAAEPEQQEGSSVAWEAEAPYLHRLIEVMRLAFADTRWYCADPNKVHVPVEELLSDGYAKERAALFDPERASADVLKGTPTTSSCTVSFQVVDEAGNAVSFVNSNYFGFGTGIVPEGCGFSLHSRGVNFSLDPSHPNALSPNKRPYHTIIPCMVTHEDTGELYATLTNMGAFMQPQGHVQLLMNLLARKMDPQAAVDSPRFCIRTAEFGGNGKVALEPGAPEEAAEELRRMGHDVVVVHGYGRCEFGRAQIILRKVSSAGDIILWAGSDGRADGCAVAW